MWHGLALWTVALTCSMSAFCMQSVFFPTVPTPNTLVQQDGPQELLVMKTRLHVSIATLQALNPCCTATYCCTADLALVLQPQELDLVMAQPHTCTAILQALGQLVAASRIKEVQKLRIDENITALQDTLGGCERWVRLVGGVRKPASQAGNQAAS